MGVPCLLRRFFINPLLKESQVILDGEELHHLKQVLRLKRGDSVVLVDGQGCEYLSQIMDIKFDKACLKVISKKRYPPPEVKPVLILSLLKPRAMDWAIQKATEIGVWEIIVCPTKYSVVKVDNVPKKLDRWQKIAIEAIKQSGRVYLPHLTFSRFSQIRFKEKCLKLLAVGPREEATTRPILEVLQEDKDSDYVYLFIGPEGGFDKAEIVQALNAGFIAISLNPHILRAETAVACGLGIIEAALMFKDNSHHRDYHRVDAANS